MSSSNNWTIDQLKSALSDRAEIKGWVVVVDDLHRRERYFMTDDKSADSSIALDQDREVNGQDVRARIFVKKSTPNRQGEISKKFFPALLLAPQIESAIYSALQTDTEEWSLPGKIEGDIAAIKTADPMIEEDLDGAAAMLSAQIVTHASKKIDVTFNSAELFVSRSDNAIHLSNGLTHRSSRTQVYIEAAYSAGGKDEDEFVSRRYGVRLDDISIEGLFNEAAERAANTTQVRKPEPGTYPVLVDAEVLSILFHDYLAQLSASSSYLNLPYIKPGNELVPGATGDLITLTVDPWRDFGADAAALAEDGLLQKPIMLVRDNLVLSSLAGKQYADYLKIDPTTSRGNVVVGPGRANYKELTEVAPRVLEILQFSALFTDSSSGTFSSEIRLARLFDNKLGTVEYIKGGSVSGSIFQNFKGVKFSNNSVARAEFGGFSSGSGGHGYFGPEFALLSDVSVVG